MGKKAIIALITISLILVGLAASERIAKADSSSPISFNGGITLYSPLNETYTYNFLNLSLSASLSAGVHTTINYSIDGEDLQGPLALVYAEAGFPFYTGNSSFELPYLAAGSHSLTIYEQSVIPDYHGANPPGAPFKQVPNSSDWAATWVDAVYFSINSGLASTEPTSTPTPTMTWLTIDLADHNYMNNVVVGQPVHFSAVISSGVPPYSYEWKYRSYYVGTTIGDFYPTGDWMEGPTTSNFTLTANATGSYLIEVKVWDSAGAYGMFMSLPPGIWVNAKNSTTNQPPAPSPTPTSSLSPSLTSSPSPSVPELPSWIILPIMATATFAALAYAIGIMRQKNH